MGKIQKQKVKGNHMKEVSLHPRQRKLIYILNSRHGIVTGKKLAEQLNISPRTVRYDIDDINNNLKPEIQVEAIHGKGYTLKIKDRVFFHELFAKEPLLDTREDRIRYLIMRLINEKDWVNMDDLEDTLFVSRSTLKKDIESIKSQIGDKRPYLQLLRRENFIRFEENEDKQRRVLIQLYCENWDFDSREGVLFKDDLMNQETLDHIRRVIKDVLRDSKVTLDDYGLIFLTLSIAMSYQRKSKGFGLGDDGTKARGYTNDKVGKNINDTAGKICRELFEYWGIEPDQDEINWISGILNQLLIFSFKKYSFAEAIGKTEVQCEIITKMITEEINTNFGADFSQDQEFGTSMILHLQALRNNMISVQDQHMYMLGELKKEYPLLADIAAFLRKRIEQLCDMKLGDAEECYLMPILIPAWERILKKQRGNGVPAVVVSHLSASMTGLLIYRLKEAFGDRLDLLGPVPIYDKSHIDQLNPQLIISTAQMDAFRKFDAPVVITSLLVNDEEKKRISLKIQELSNESRN